MKKLVLLLAVAFSVSMFSCGNGDKGGNQDSLDSVAKADSLAKVEAEAAAAAQQVEETVDTTATAVDTTAAQN